MRTIYLGHHPGYARICHNETELMAVFWHGGKGNLAERTKTMLDYCIENKITTVNHSTLHDIVKKMIRSLNPDLIVVGEYHFLIGEDIFNMPKYGTINLHGAPLPRYRGAHPINWMIINGESKGAVTCHYISEGIDEGDIIDQYIFSIDETETAYEVRPKIEATGQRLLKDVLQRFKREGRLRGIPQDESRALYTPPRKPEDGLIDWSLSPRNMYNFIRALTKPYPGAFAIIGDRKVKVWRIELPNEENIRHNQTATPGTVLEVSKEKIIVAANNGTINIVDWDLEGRNIKVNDHLRGKESQSLVIKKR